MNNKKFAYCTVITNDDYTPCIIRQKQRMDYLKCKYPFIVLVTDNIIKNYKNQLEENNINYRIIKNKKFKIKDLYYEDTFNKFQILNLIDFDLVLFLDADSIMIENFDEIFIKYQNLIKDGKNFSFFASFRKNETCLNADGTFFFCKPSKKLYNLVFNKYRLFFENHFNDEQIFNFYFFNCFNFIPLYSLPKNYHFAGILKIWNFANISKYLNDIFYGYSYEEFNKFVDNYKNNIEFDIILKAIQNFNQSITETDKNREEHNASSEI